MVIKIHLNSITVSWVWSALLVGEEVLSMVFVLVGLGNIIVHDFARVRWKSWFLMVSNLASIHFLHFFDTDHVSLGNAWFLQHRDFLVDCIVFVDIEHVILIINLLRSGLLRSSYPEVLFVPVIDLVWCLVKIEKTLDQSETELVVVRCFCKVQFEYQSQMARSSCLHHSRSTAARVWDCSSFF